MKSIPTLDVPDELHAELEARARRHQRSLRGEVVAILSDVVPTAERPDSGPNVTLEEAERISRLVKGPGLTIAEIQNAIDEGRH